MNLLGPDDSCPNCEETDVPCGGSSLAGRATYECPACANRWTTGWTTEPRENARVRELDLLSPYRFADPDPEGRYVYDDEDDW